ncbi:MAG: hypothetical protein US13_C0001G0045 [candidate division TM6 bacterium GW2011_GWE2_36_25]|nr:MAG: hypothetical protein US03_C0001G0159 [candidate division TM6 bacterium GW2011_GWF2_36_131]KKQ03705.1 MAG: hypothetical protein US13_C0001G0045 [candidate division TM6 bacterium GW2011_GWE2_36_25]KKQ20059.1 MAG: hypothetical protein US32_C0002G0064 [candidate division TM6 bacterium GW2011_GWA2_36_9]
MITLILKIAHKIHRLCNKNKNKTTLINNQLPEKSFVIVITSYNNERYCEKNLASVLNQNYSNFRVIYIDDCSTDKTSKITEEYIKNNDHQKKISFFKNKQRNLKLANLYQIIHTLPDEEVVIELDGDDYLAHPHVLKIINQKYHETNALIVHATYENQPANLAEQLKLQHFSQETPYFVKKLNLFRKYPWIYSGLRTYYVGLFKKINKEDLLCKIPPFEGKFFPVSHDLAIMYPMLEKAHTQIAYIPDKLLIRNIDSSINDFKKYDSQLRKKINQQIIS